MRFLYLLLALALLAPMAQAQIIYRDVAPDSTVTASNASGSQTRTYNLDFDASGGPADLFFSVDATSSTGGGVTANLVSVTVGGDSISIASPIVSNNGKEFAEPVEDGVDFGPGSDLQNISGSELWLFEGRDVTAQPQVDFANLPFDRDTLLGFTFQSSGNTHYGWIRIQLARNAFQEVSLTVLEWAYNATPDEAIEAGTVPEAVTAPTIDQITDVRDDGTVADLSMLVGLTDSTDIASIRVFFVAETEASSFNRGLAETVVAGRFGTIAVNSQGNFSFRPEATQVDVNGQTIVPDSSYVAFALAVPKASAPKISALSAASAPFVFTTTLPATGLSITPLSDPITASEEVSFSFTAPAENGTLDYRVYALPASDTANFSVNIANAAFMNSLSLEDIDPGTVVDTLPAAFTDFSDVEFMPGTYVLVVGTVNPTGLIDDLSNYAAFEVIFPDAVEPGTVAPGIQLYAHQRSVYVQLQPEHLAQAPRLTLTNLAGQQLLGQPVSSLSTQINLSELPAGLYLAQLRDAEGALLGSRKLLLR